MNARPYTTTAAVLLAAGMGGQFAWHLAQPSAQADVWNASGALLALLLLGLVANAYRSPEVWRVLALLGIWQAMTAGCSIAYLVRPWPIEPGQGQCSAALNMPLALMGAWLASVLAATLWGRR